MYGRATEAEAHSRPTTDLLKTFRGPFKEIMQSKAMRWISQEDLDKHNYKAKQLGAYHRVVRPRPDLASDCAGGYFSTSS